MNLPPPYPLQALYHRPGFLLRRMHQMAVGLFEERFREQRLTPPQFGVLYVLASCGVLDQSALARALGYDRVTTLRIVRGLASRGLLDKAASTGPGRKMLLRLTPAGVALVDACAPAADQISEQVLSPLSRPEQAQFMALLAKLCEGHAGQARVPVTPPPPQASPDTRSSGQA